MFLFFRSPMSYESVYLCKIAIVIGPCLEGIELFIIMQQIKINYTLLFRCSK